MKKNIFYKWLNFNIQQRTIHLNADKKIIIHKSVFLIFSVCLLSCGYTQEVKTSEIIDKERINKEKLKIFYEYSLDPISFNDFKIPVYDLKSTYSQLKLYSYMWKDTEFKMFDSIIYEDKINKSIFLNDNNLIKYQNITKGAFKGYSNVFEYDSNNVLVKIQGYDNLKNKGGKTEFAYNSNYSEMYVICTNKYTPNIKDTLEFYKFDSLGLPSSIIKYSDKFYDTKTISYGSNGLIELISQKIIFKRDNSESINIVKYNYKYNKYGDWIEVILSMKPHEYENYTPFVCVKRVLID